MTPGDLPVQDPAFWKRRLLDVVATGKDLHKAIYDIDYKIWSDIQDKTKSILKQYLRPGDRVLDAGCGLGNASGLVPRGCVYTGIDVSPHLLEIARVRHPNAHFVQGDLRSMPEFSDKQFDWAVCRSIRGMIWDNLGAEAWDAILSELRRVSKRILLMEYGEGALPVEVIES